MCDSMENYFFEWASYIAFLMHKQKDEVMILISMWEFCFCTVSQSLIVFVLFTLFLRKGPRDLMCDAVDAVVSNLFFLLSSLILNLKLIKRE